MARKLVVGLVVILLFVAAGTAFALLSGRDDDNNTDTAQGTTTTVATSASTPSGSTTAPTTTAPSSTSTSSAVVDGCGADGAAIAAAVNAGVTGARDKAQVDQCRLAGDPSWAGVRLVAKPGADFATVTLVLHSGGGSWSIVGSGDAACANTPQQVLVDLGLLCSSSGGGGL